MSNQLRKRIGKIQRATDLGEIYGGTATKDCPTVLAAMKLADLDWETQKAPVCLSDRLRTKIPGMFGTYRTAGPGQNIPFGTVKGRYRPMHNRESFLWLDKVLGGKNNACIVAGGMFNGGKKVWMAVDLGGFEAVKGDEIRNIMVVMNSNDGSSHWSVHLVPLRVASQTMMNFHETDGFHKIRHTRGADLNASEIAEIMKNGTCLLKSFEKSCKAMGKEKLKDEDADKVILEALGVSRSEYQKWEASAGKQPQWVNQFETIKEMLKSGPACELGKGTTWQVLMAVQGYFDHIRTVRGSGENGDNLFESKLVGYSAKQKAQSFTVCASGVVSN